MHDAYAPFVLSLCDTTRLFEVDEILAEFLGQEAHRSMIAHFGFSSKEIGLVAKVNRPGFTGDCLVLLTRLYRLRSCLHRKPPQLRLA